MGFPIVNFASLPGEHGKCKVDSDIAGLGVIAAFVVAAAMTTGLAVCAAILDILQGHSDAVLPAKTVKRLHDRWGVGLSVKGRYSLTRKMIDRVMLSLADQQLLTGFAIMISFWLRYHDYNDHHRNHVDLVMYLSCLSSSSHLASVITLKRYFKEHSMTARLRMVLIILYALFLTSSIIITMPFPPFYQALVFFLNHVFRCDDFDCASTLPYIVFYFLTVVFVFYPFWVAFCQVFEGARRLSELAIRTTATCLAPLCRRLHLHARIAKRWPTAGRALSSTGRGLVAAFWFILFGNLHLAFVQQLFFVSISLAFVFLQKFAEPPQTEDDEGPRLCGLNLPSTNVFGFGEILSLIMLVQPAFSAVSTYYELQNEKLETENTCEDDHHPRPQSPSAVV
ncbi:hypothetical protein IWX90DRAFT_504706 [Phyllosticta citrichinensis]|uniref:Uncharacterized protein n=1 Tax=Phyllosticta citrichinensis TaxID=1130410 RepID=A0ABR1XQF9_9PEZI